MIRTVLLAITAATAAGILFVNLYTSIVDAPNWGAQLPESISAARAYFSVANPGSFFRVFSPANQILAVLALILCWKTNRKNAIALLASAILLEAFTFGYFYPRNDIMFFNTTIDENAVRTAWQEWSTMNWVRSALCLVNTVLAFTLLLSENRKLQS